MKKKTIPFIILAIFHGIILAYTFYKNKQKTLTVLFINIGVGYVFEYFVLNVFKLYTYYPKVFKNRWIDSVFGALLSQSLFVPIASTFLVVFQLGWKWRIGVSLFFGIVERLFIRWRVFKKNGWNTLYTITAMPFYFYVVNKWWNDIERGDELKRSASLFFFHWTTYTNILYFMLALFNKYFFHIGLLKNRYWEHFMLVPVYTLISALVTTFNTITYKKIKPMGVLLLHLFDQVLFRLRIIQPSKKLYLYMLILVHIFLMWIGNFYYELLNKFNEES